jgi:surface antigen
MHRYYYSANALRTLPALGLVLALAACAPYTRPDPPGFLGALFDRAPPPVTVIASGPYPGPLSEPSAPIITPATAAIVVAEPLLAGLGHEARLSLAEASMRAASAPTGTTVLWKSADADGAVIAARDVYRSHRGEICRDLRQQVQTATGPATEQITLCRADRGDNRVLWLPGSAD